MSGSGRKTVDGHYLTGLKEIRELAAADADVAAVDEIIHMELDDNDNPVANGTGSLFLYVCAEGAVTGYTFKLYAKPAGLDDDESSSSSGDPACSWYLMAERVVANPEEGMAFGFKDMPCVQYKVVFSAIAGSGVVELGEQHTV